MKRSLLPILTGILCFGIALTSCSRDDRNVITYKSQLYDLDKPMPKGLCRFAVGEGMDHISFVDSCHFYHMLDTIK